MINIQGIDHIVLRVTDMARMMGFYCDVLGCKLEREQPDLGLIQLRAGRTLLDLVNVTGVLGKQGGAAPGREGRNLDHFCFKVDPFDPDSLRDYLSRFGVVAQGLSSRYGAEGQGLSFFVQDPEGNHVEIKGPAV